MFPQGHPLGRTPPRSPLRGRIFERMMSFHYHRPCCCELHRDGAEEVELRVRRGEGRPHPLFRWVSLCGLKCHRVLSLRRGGGKM